MGVNCKLQKGQILIMCLNIVRFFVVKSIDANKIYKLKGKNMPQRRMVDLTVGQKGPLKGRKGIRRKPKNLGVISPFNLITHSSQRLAFVSAMLELTDRTIWVCYCTVPKYCTTELHTLAQWLITLSRDFVWGPVTLFLIWKSR